MKHQFLTVCIILFALASQAGAQDFKPLTALVKMAELSEDSISPALARVKSYEQRIRNTQRVEAAIYETAISLYDDGSDSTDYRRLALSDMDALAKARAADYAEVVKIMPQGHFYNNDMLSVIGYELQAFQELNTYYDQHGNRNAALLTALEILKNKQHEMTAEAFLEQLDSLERKYYGEEAIVEVLATHADAMEHLSKDEQALFLKNAISQCGDNERANVLKNAYAKLTQPFIQISTNRDLLTSQEQLLMKVKTRNIRQLRVTLYPTGKTAYEIGFSRGDYNKKDMNEKAADIIKACQGNYAESCTIDMMAKGRKDYETYTDSVSLKPQKKGIYLLRVEDAENSEVTPIHQLVSVSDLRPVTFPTPTHHRADDDYPAILTMVDAITSQPLTGITVTDTDCENDMTTNSNGEVTIDIDHIDDSYFAHSDTDSSLWMFDTDGFFYGGDDEEKKSTEMVVITDRNIYRPGQKIEVAVVAYSKKRHTFKALPNKNTDIILSDPQGKKVMTTKATTDEWGTAHATLEIPQRAALGSWNIRVNDKWNWSTSVKVEEYKRPTFKVNLHNSSEQLCLGDTLHLKGEARMLTDTPLANAMVVMNVSGQGLNRKTLAVMTDTLLTDGDGLFQLSVPLTYQGEQQEPVDKMTFNISATVTSPSGESHEATKNVFVGKKPIRLNCVVSQDSYCFERDSIGSKTFCMKAVNAMGEHVDMTVNYWLEGTGTPKVRQVRSNQQFSITQPLVCGKYTLVAEAAGDTLRMPLIVYSLNDKVPCFNTPEWLITSGDTFDATGKKPSSVWIGSSDENCHIIYAVYNKDRLLEHGALEVSNSIYRHDFKYKKSYGDGITVIYMWWKNGNYHQLETQFTAPMPDKSLKASWQTFRDKLKPGMQEQWRLRLTTPDGQPAKARVIAALYDQSLDLLWTRNSFWKGVQITPAMPYISGYNFNISGFYETSNAQHTALDEGSNVMSWLAFNEDERTEGSLGKITGMVTDELGDPLIGASIIIKGSNKGTVTDINGRFVIAAPMGSILNVMYIGYETKSIRVLRHYVNLSLEPDDNALEEVVVVGYGVQKKELLTGSVSGFMIRGTQTTQKFSAPVIKKDEQVKEVKEEETMVWNAQIPLRENMSETAFFMPTLNTDADGNVDICFTLPDCVTTWRFLASAYTKDMRATDVEANTVAVKDLMVQPNMPRFVRQGDNATIAARISNLTDTPCQGSATMILTTAENDSTVFTATKPFTIEGKQDHTVTFDFTAPTDESALLVCKIVAQAGGTSDGEQHYLPVVSRKERITSTLPFTLLHAGKHTFNVADMLPEHADHPTMTLEYTHNPAWLVVDALHEYANPADECAICQAATFFSNMAATAIGNIPGVSDMVNKWKEEEDSIALESPLQRNEELKNIMLEESPWTVTAEVEGRQRQHLAEFLNVGKRQKPIEKALKNLTALQNKDGSWSWFKGMEGNPYITMTVAELLVRTRKLTSNTLYTDEMLNKAFKYLADRQDSVATPEETFSYLYLCAADHRHVDRRKVQHADSIVNRLHKNTTLTDIYSAAQAAIVLHSLGDAKAQALLDDILALSVRHNERGRYFDTYRAGYSWLDYKIPTQVMVMEALAMLRPGDVVTRSEMQQWLLQEKRTQYWLTTINSIDAAFAFLFRNTDPLEEQPLPVMTIDNHIINTAEATSGLGYVKKQLPADGRQLSIDHTTETTSWGAVYAQYDLPADEVVAKGSDLSVKREVIAPHKGTLRVGDKIRIRITLTAQRDLDFVQVVDKRPACMEPTEPLSGFNWRQRYYCAYRDSATHFFIDMLKKGTTVIENEYYVDRAGTYKSGTISAQCAYAPEYQATAPSVTITVEQQSTAP